MVLVSVEIPVSVIFVVRAALCSIIKSPAVWAITATHVTQNFGYYVLLTELPTYMKNVLGWDLKDKVRGSSGLKQRYFSSPGISLWPPLPCNVVGLHS